MKEIGEYLKQTRCENGVSIDEVAADLEVDAILIENIESANVRAFKDVYYLKDLVRRYAKYLGLDPAKVQDEFNDFMFEHTSKISLDDILEAKKKKEEEERKGFKKIQSPYTKEYKKKKVKLPIVMVAIIFVLVFVVLVVAIKTINRKPNMNNELKGNDCYEYTY